MSETVGSVIVEVHARIDALEREIRRGTVKGAEKAGKDSGKVFGSSFKRNVAAFTGGLLGAGAIVGAIRGLRQLGSESLKAAAEQSAANAIVARAVENAGTEMELFGKSIEDALQAESLLTGIADQELAPAFVRLLRVTQDNQKAFDGLRLAEDLARQQGISVATAALAIAKAYQGNVVSLQRYGIVLQGVTSETTKAEKAQLALARITEVAGGTALTFSESDAGRLERAAVSIDEIKETLGQAILPTVGRIADRIATWFADPKNQKRVEEAIDDTLSTTEEIGRAAFKIGDLIATPFKGFALTGKLLNDDLQSAADFMDRISGADNIQLALNIKKTFELKEQLRLRKLGAREGLTSEERGITGPAFIPPEPANRPGLQGVAGVSTFDPERQRQIRELQAELTESDNDNKKLAEARRKNLQAQIAAIGDPRGKNDQDRLIRLYEELGDATGEINDIERAAKDARDDALEERKKRTEEDRDNARQKYRDDLQISRDRIQLSSLTASTEGQINQARRREIDFLRERVNDTKLTNRERLDAQLELAQLEKDQRDEQKRISDERKEAKFGIREQRLQNAAQRAELTKTEADDKKAQRALIRFYGNAAKQARKTGDTAKALQLESQKIGAQLAARGNQASGGDGGGRTDFFQEAANQFRQFGSNIGRAGDPLSGQDARGQFAGFALERGRNTAALAADQLNESQSHTVLLREIRDRLRIDTRVGEGSQPARRLPPHATAVARTAAQQQLAGR